MIRDKVDPITVEILRNRFENIASQMQLTLLRSSASVIVKEGEDGSTGLFDGEGNVVAQACANVIHLAVMGPAIRAVRRKFGPDQIDEGDLFILNDPYDGGTHLPDILLVKPVFWDHQLIAFSVALAHHEDVGGKAAGSMPANSTELFQEGLVIPPSKLLIRGARNAMLFDLISANVRVPETVLGDLSGELAAVSIGERELLRTVEEFGLDVVRSSITELFRQAESRMRDRIRAFPEGRFNFVDWIDNDGFDLTQRVRIECTIYKDGSDIVADFTGTGPQAKGPTNLNYWGAASAVYFGLRAVLDPELPTNEGAHAPIRVVIPEGCLLNPRRPAPICLRAQTSKRVADAVLGALVKALPGRVPAASGGSITVFSFGGFDESGRRFACSDLIAVGFGGRPTKDGIDAIDTDIGNCQLVPAEAFEARYPLRVLKSELIHNSGGAGKFRGGLGIRREFEILHGPVTTCYRSERHNSDPWGLEGGRPGSRHRASIRRADGRVEPVRTRQILTLDKGDVLVVETGGGGGYGDPLERDPALVLNDIVLRKISVERAKSHYGVVVDTGRMEVDLRKTRARRKQVGNRRGSINWTFDRGADGHE